MDVGKIIKAERTKHGLTQEQLAQEFFVTRQLVSKWENGKSYPDLEQVVKLSEFFQLSLDQLLRDDQEMVKELNLDSHRKRWFKGIILLLAGILLILGGIYGALSWMDMVMLNPEDIQITKVEKRLLPQKEVENQLTGQLIQLPEDEEITIYFKTTRPFIDLSRISGYKGFESKDWIQVETLAYRKLWGGRKESSLVIRSSREKSLTLGSLNKGKNIYLYDQKSKKPPMDGDLSKDFLLVTKEQLAELPYTK